MTKRLRKSAYKQIPKKRLRGKGISETIEKAHQYTTNTLIPTIQEKVVPWAQEKAAIKLVEVLLNKVILDPLHRRDVNNIMRRR